MEQTVYVSRVGDAARVQGVSVAEMQRRLAKRGLRVSRGALDRLFSQRPVREVSLEIIVPVLEELDLDLRSAFDLVVRSDADERSRARSEAAALVRQFPFAKGRTRSRDATSRAAAELDEITGKLEARLKHRHPEVFDRRGRLRRRTLTQLLTQRAGKRLLTDEDLRALGPRPASKATRTTAARGR
jgi:hypothetical protein